MSIKCQLIMSVTRRLISCLSRLWEGGGLGGGCKLLPLYTSTLLLDRVSQNDDNSNKILILILLSISTITNLCNIRVEMLY